MEKDVFHFLMIAASPNYTSYALKGTFGKTVWFSKSGVLTVTKFQLLDYFFVVVNFGSCPPPPHTASLFVFLVTVAARGYFDIINRGGGGGG